MERRTCARIGTDQFVHIEFGSDEFLVAEGVNISTGGLLCRVSYPIGESERIHLLLSLEESDNGRFGAEAEGRVVRLEDDGDGSYLLGIRFEAVPRETGAAIGRYISEIQSGRYG